MKVRQHILFWLNISIILSFVFAVEVRGQKGKRPTAVRTSSTPVLSALLPSNAFSSFPSGQAKRIDLEIEEDATEGMTVRERSDQIKDWLLFAVLNDSKLPAAALNQVTFDLPASRRKYFQPVANFEYGETRSRFIGGGKIVVLIPICNENERFDYLASVADEHRKNLGETPATLLVFEYKINPTQQTAELTRREDFKVADLYTEQAGYYEAAITDLASFERFLERIEDVTFASRSSNQLRLGGRKMKSRPYRGIRVEDVAAIWKSENIIAEREKTFDNKWSLQEKRFREVVEAIIKLTTFLRNYDNEAANLELTRIRTIYLTTSTQNLTLDQVTTFSKNIISTSLYTKVNALIATYNSGNIPLYNSLVKQVDQEIRLIRSALQNEYSEDKIASNVVSQSGFSLDPAYDYLSLAEFFKNKLAPRLKELARARSKVITNVDIDKAGQGIDNNDETAFLQLLNKIDVASAKDEENPDVTYRQWQAQKDVKFKKYVSERLLPALKKLSVLQPPLVETNAINNLEKSIENPFLFNFELNWVFEKLAEVTPTSENNLAQIKEEFLLEANSDSGGQILNYAKKNFSYQHARYDGELQGTEVGMVLFYTDLLAKLWSIDYTNSTPRNIKDLIPMPDIRLSPIYTADSQALKTRLWFGTQDKGFQTFDGGQKLAFSRQATRLFAKSSNPYTPTNEVEANMLSSLFLNWWDNHFEEVAQHEPQYQRLNEIMKWSSIVGWLNDAEKGDALAFLQNVTVKRDNRFLGWAEKNTDLKFKNWEQLGFYPDNYKGSKTEALPLLRSRPLAIGGILQGGVSLAGKSLFKTRTPLKPQVNELIRRPNIDYGAKTTAGSVKTLEGNSFDVKSLPNGDAQVTSKSRPNAKLRDTSSELAVNPTFDRKLTRSGDNLVVEIQVAKVKVGAIEFKSEADSLKISWKSRDIDEGHSFARKLSRQYDEVEAETFFKSEPNVERAYANANREYLVKLRGSDKWMKLAPESEGSTTVAKGWTSRVADRQSGVSSYNAKWIDAPIAAKEFRTSRLIVDNTSVRNAPLTSHDLALADALLSRNEPVKAAKYLDYLIERSGKLPELKLRQGLALSKRGQFEAAQQKFTESLPPVGEARNRFFDELNTRQRQEGKGVEFVPNGDRFSLRQSIDAYGKKIAPEKIPENALIYVEDSPGLNNVDWSVGIKRALDNPVVGNLADVVKLPRGGIGGFKPTEVYSDGGNGGIIRRFNSIAKGPVDDSSPWIVAKPFLRSTNTTLFVPCSEDDENDKYEDEDEDENCDIYVVIDKSRED